MSYGASEPHAEPSEQKAAVHIVWAVVASLTVGSSFSVTHPSLVSCLFVSLTFLEKIVIDNGQDALLNELQVVILRCPSVLRDDCVWTKNKGHVDIQNRYRFINNNQQRQPRDCSIEIVPLMSFDEGEWECQIDDHHPAQYYSFCITLYGKTI